MKRILFIIFGSVSLGLGFLGIFLPVLPSTPFFLLTAWLYMRSSPALYKRLIESKRIGPYIIAFQEEKAIPLRIKIISVSMLWAALILSAVLVGKWWLCIILAAVGAGVTAHILSFKTKR